MMQTLICYSKYIQSFSFFLFLLFWPLCSFLSAVAVSLLSVPLSPGWSGVGGAGGGAGIFLFLGGEMRGLSLRSFGLSAQPPGLSEEDGRGAKG